MNPPRFRLLSAAALTVVLLSKPIDRTAAQELGLTPWRRQRSRKAIVPTRSSSDRWSTTSTRESEGSATSSLARMAPFMRSLPWTNRQAYLAISLPFRFVNSGWTIRRIMPFCRGQAAPRSQSCRSMSATDAAVPFR